MFLRSICFFILCFALHGRAQIPTGYSLEDWPYSHRNIHSHELQVINDGLTDLALRLQMIDRASESIEYMTFEFENDLSGKLILQALEQAAVRGVKVKLLIDAFHQNSHSGVPKDLIGQILRYVNSKQGALESSLLDVRYYNRSDVILDPLKFNHRNHAKLLIIDSRELLMGGRNTADPYFEMSSKDLNYMDRDVWVQPTEPGLQDSIPRQAQSAFLKYWNAKDWTDKEDFESYIPSELDLHDPTIDPLVFTSSERIFLKQTENKGLLALRKIPTFKSENLCFVIDRPDHNSNSRKVTQLITSLLSKNIKYGIFEQWAFVLSPLKFNLFKDLFALSKPNLIFLTNGAPTSEDSELTELIQDTETEALKLSKNMWIYELLGRREKENLYLPTLEKKVRFASHAKSFVLFVDQTTTTAIGSYNFDPRSEQINSESMLFIDNQYEVSRYVAQWNAPRNLDSLTS
jgi:putative cardiolipin synthase